MDQSWERAIPAKSGGKTMTLAMGNLSRDRSSPHGLAPNGPSITLVVAVLAAFGAATLSPIGNLKDGAAATIATLLLVMASAIALFAWVRGNVQRARPSYWDVAGALTFIGICVAQTIEPAELVALIEGADRKP
jgi:hypothetical protein